MTTGRNCRHPRLRPIVRRGRRAIVIITILATALMGSLSPASAAAANPATISWAGVWHWLGGRGPALRVPLQQGGTARGRPHEVPASADLARGGRGLPPHQGRGQLPPFRLHGPVYRRSVTGPSVSSAAPSFNPRTSTPVMSKATATSTLYRNTNGSYTRIVSARPVNYRAAGGSWRPINTALRRTRPGGPLQETASAMPVSLAAQASGASLVSVALGAAQPPAASDSVSYGLSGAAPVPALVSGSTATYHDILPQTDLTLSAIASGLQESLILHTPTAPESWTFPLRLNGLTAKLTSGGQVDLVTASGQVAAVIPRAYMTDSSVHRPSGMAAQSSAVTYQLVTSGGQPALRMTASRQWLDSPARVYPVTIDPSFTASGTTYVENTGAADYSDYDDMEVGTYDGGGVIGNSFLAFSGLGSALAGERITAASLSLWDMWAGSCQAAPFHVSPVTQSWPVTGSKSYPGPSYGSSIGSATITPTTAECETNTGGDTSVGGWMTASLSTSTFNSWTTGGADYGLAVTAAATGDLSWKRFDSDNSPNPPYLTLTYTPDVPPQINSQYPPSNYQSPTLTPDLVASGTDPDNWPVSPVKYDFTVYSTTGATVATSGNISADDWVVPAGKLSWAQTYYWAVQDYDGYSYSSAPTANYLTTQVPQPVITSTLSQNDSGHGFDPSAGNYTTSATDASVQTAGPSLSVERDYNSLDPRVSGAFGAAWSSLPDMKATEVDDASGNLTSVDITYPDGSEVGFGDSGGTFTPPLGRYATLTALPGHGGYTLTDKNDTVYTFSQPTSVPNVFGVSSIADYEGRTETFTYNGAGQLTAITSQVSGRALHFTWTTPSGAQYPHVASVSTDPATAGQPSTALTWTYGYSGDSLTSVCPPASPAACTTYAYATGSHYPTAVLDTGPAAYWRMAEASGSTATDSVLANEGADNGTYSNVTLGQPGAMPGSGATSASFNGTSSYLQLPASMTSSASVLTGGYFSVGLWFKTTTAGGVLFGYQASPLSAGTASGAYTPCLYVGADGRLEGDFGAAVPIASAGPVADGNWHYAVLTAAGSTESLYLDGTLAGSSSAQAGVTGQPDVYIGAGFLGGTWPDEPHSSATSSTGYAGYFNGQVSDVAMYGSYLTAPTVHQLYAAGTAASGLLTQITAPSGNVDAQISYNSVTDRVTSVTDENGGTWGIGTPTVTGTSQVYRSVVLGGGPAGYWRLGDSGSATQAADQVNGGAGSYNNVTLGATGPFSDQTAAAFNGTSSYAQLPANDAPGTGTSSIGLWFMVPSGNTAGGILYSYQSSSLGQATSQWDPALYVGTDGKLRGEIWNGTATPITSGSAVNDGKWHYAVLAASSGSQSLYLDGQLMGTSTAALQASPGNDVYVGAGVSGGNWPDRPANAGGYFTGSIAEVAFYRSQLSAAKVLTQWLAAKSSSGLAPTETIDVTDPGAHTLTYTYAPLEGDRIISQTDGLGSKTSYGYDTSGFLYTTTDPDGDVVTTGHDVRGNLVSQSSCQDQAASECSTEYYSYYPDDTSATLTPDPRNDLVLTIRDGRSASAADNTYLTTYAYNSAGNQISATTPPVPGYPSGRTTTMTYTTSSTLATGGGTAPAGLLASTTTPGGATEAITYYADGDPATVTDPAGEVTTYTYDGLGRVLTKTVISSSYPAGLRTSYTYDGQNRLLTETDPPVTDLVTGATHTPRTTNTYDSNGNLTAVTVADLTGGDASRTTSYSYNSHDQLASSADPDGDTTAYTYDRYGSTDSKTDPAGRTTYYTYDADSHLLTATLAGYVGDPVNPSPPTSLIEQSRAYDPDGRLASITDAMGRVTAYTYTDNALVATITRENPATGQSFAVQANTYDAANNLIKQVTANGTETTTFAVDAADRTDSTTLDPSGLDRTTAYSYSPDDFVVNTTVSDASGQASSIDTAYDPLGRMTSKAVHDDAPGHPAGWWPLTGGASATATYSPTFAPDQSGNGNTAALSPGVTWSSGAASFNGSSGVLATATPVVNTTQSYSVSAWVNLAADSTGGGYDAVSESGASAPAFELQYSGGYGGWSFTSASADSGSTSWDSAHLTTKPALNTWTHLVGVFNSGTGAMSLYVNGTLAASGTDPAPWKSSGSLGIGGDEKASGAQSQTFDGQVSNVQVYQRALSAADVTALYADGRTGGALGTKTQTTTWTLDQRGLPTSMTDPDGDTTSYLYDQAGKEAEVTGPTESTETDGGSPVTTHPVTTYGYDTFGEQTSTEDPNGNITTVNYDAAGQPVSQVLPSYTPPGSSTPITATSSKTYNSLGEVTSATDPLGNTTTYTYDQLGDTATMTQPGGGVTHDTYDTDGDLLTSTDPAGAQTQATYDYLGRQLTSTQVVRQPSPTADTTTSAYADPGGYLSSTTSPAGVTASYSYDAAGEVTGVTNGTGNTTSYGYDALGRRISVTLPDGTGQRAGYDEAGNPVTLTSTDAMGNVLRQTSAGYDADGNLTSSTDALGDTTTYSYNPARQPVQEVQPVSASSSITTSFGYDADGNLTRYTDGNGNPTSYTYNAWNLPESTILPATAASPDLASRTFTTTYNAGGEPVQQTEPGGVTTTSAYDALGDLTSQAGSGADAPTTTRTFGYNTDGELTSASAPGGTDSFGYDDRGLLLSATGPSGSSSFGYNADGQLSAQTTAAGTSSYGYDGDGRLSSLTDAATGASLSYSYNADSELAGIGYGTGAASQSFTYNGLQELTGDTLTGANGTTEASIAYGYNANGGETSKTTTGFDGSSANTYTYDEADRLTSWNNGTTTVSYAYDADGNRTQAGSQTFSYDARDELLSGGGTSYSYTARGTLASATTGGTTTTSTYDAFGQLITQGGQTYAYDALGRVITGQGQTLSYAGQTNDVASDGSYTYSRDPDGDLIGISGAPGSVLALTDQHLDVVGEFTATGAALAGSTTYGPLGAVTATTGMAGHLGYQSGWTDPATSDVNMGSRWYNPAAGQFMSKDAASNSPLPDSVAANTFAYGNDNPLTAIDLMGTCTGFFCGAGQFFSNLGATAHNAWNVVTAAASKTASVVNQGWQWYQANWRSVNGGKPTPQALQAAHAVITVVHDIKDGYDNAIARANQNCNVTGPSLSCTQFHTATQAVSATYHAVKYVAKSAIQYVANHPAATASAIIGAVVGTVAFSVCEAVVGIPTAGVGAVLGAAGCGALSGAVGSAAAYALTTPQNEWSLGNFAKAVAIGTAVGAAGGVAAKYFGPFVKGILNRLGPAAADDGAAAAADAAATAPDGGQGAGDQPPTPQSPDQQPPAEQPPVDQSPAEPATTETGSPAAPETEPATTPEAEPTTGTEPGPEPGSEDAAPSCGGNSFTGGTRVLLANGKRIAIDKVKPGQKILATNTRTDRTQARTVDAVLVHYDRDLYDLAVTANGRTTIIATTNKHLFWNQIDRRWVEATMLRKGQSLSTPTGATAKVQGGYGLLLASGWMWDLTIQGDHDFYIAIASSAVLVHNCTLKEYADSQREVPGTKFASEYTSPSGGVYQSTNRHGLISQLEQLPELNDAIQAAGHHGGCAEVGCLIEAYRKEGPSAILGGTMETVNVRNPVSSRAFEQGTPALPCGRCQRLLRLLGISWSQ